jgi:putative hydrolase of the HAD superfamily
VSNADGTVERGLTRAGLRGLLDDVVDSHVVGFEKPDPRIFAHALERSGAAPGTTLHVGDLYAADVVGARAAGLHALLLDPHGDWPPVDCARLPDVAALAHAIRSARAA